MAGAVKWFGQITLNTTKPSQQSDAAIRALPTGGFVAAWEDDSATGGDTTGPAVRAQIFTANGSTLGSEFLVNTTTANTELDPTITVLEDGRFVIAYAYNVPLGGGSSTDGTVFARIFNPNGTQSQPEFTVQGVVNGAQSFSPAVTTLIDGRWIVAWSGYDGPNFGDQGVQARIYNGNETPSAPAFPVNSTTANPQSFPVIAAAKDGGFVVAFADLSTNPTSVRARIFQNDDTPAAPDFLVGTTLAAGLNHVAITVLQSGRFVVAWDVDPAGNDPGDVHAKIYESNGALVGSEFMVNTTTAGTQAQTALAALPDGRFVAAWSSSDGIRAQVFNADGSISGSEFLASPAGLVANEPEITVLADSRFVISYSHFDQTTGSDVYAQIFDPRDGIVTGTGSPETLYGNDIVNDTITGLGGGDTLFGYGGDDTFNGGPGNDTIDGGPGFDTAVVSGHGNAYTIGHSGTTVTVSGPDGTDTLTGVEKLQFDDGYLQLLDWSFSYLRSDFGNDGRSDILWRQASGLVSLWQMNGAQVLHADGIASVGLDWHIAGLGDFNGDGKSDILWRHDSGLTSLWQMNGTQVLHADSIASVGLDQHIAGVGDFNGDGNSDILWRQDSGLVSVWQMNGAQVLRKDSVASVGPDWHIAGVGDFNGDGKSDILWRHDSGLVSLWQMDGPQVLHADSIAFVGPDWHISGLGDFNGDGKSDILWRHDSGLVSLWQINGAQVLHADNIASVGFDWHIAGVSDFNGDGKSDILWRQDGGLVSLWQMNGAQAHGDGIANIGPDWQVTATHFDLI